MMVSNETLESLGEYCSAKDRVIPKDWNKLWQMLRSRRQKTSGGWEPPLPLILAAWHETTPEEKQLRFKEHLQWAADHDQLIEIGLYLRSLSEGQWIHNDEL